MKFKVHKSDFLSVLTPAMGSVSNKNTITSIEGGLIETLDNGMIEVSSYDMNKGVRATFTPNDVEREGKYIINAQRLYQTVRALPDDELTIDINEKLNCEITCGRASFSIFASLSTHHITSVFYLYFIFCPVVCLFCIKFCPDACFF